MILVPVSLGELIDKITILELKKQCLRGDALLNVCKELSALRAVLADLSVEIDPLLVEKLRRVNGDLWWIEDAIRLREKEQSFEQDFIELARSVYQRNDERAAIKREINLRYGSAFIEEKSYSSR